MKHSPHMNDWIRRLKESHLSAAKQRMIQAELEDHLAELADYLRCDGLDEASIQEQLDRETTTFEEMISGFEGLAKQERRRQIMRFSTLCTAGCFIAIALAYSLWPNQPRLPITPASVAQDTEADPFGGSGDSDADPFGSGGGDADPFGGSGDSDADPFDDNNQTSDPFGESRPSQLSMEERNRQSEDLLNSRIDFDYIDTPLDGTLAMTFDQLGISYHVKTHKLEEIGISFDQPVTLQLNDVRGSVGIDLVLEPIQLAYYVHDGIVMITSKEDLSTSTLRIYDCRPLIKTQVAASSYEAEAGAYAGGGGSPYGSGYEDGGGAGYPGGYGPPAYASSSPKAAQLISVITTSVAPESWSLTGGPGSVVDYNGLLVVNQTAENHKKIQQLLDMLQQSIQNR